MIHLISDFNIEPLKSCLARTLGAAHEITAGPYGQVYQGLTGSNPAIDKQTTVIVWTRPEAVIESFGRVLALERVDHRRVLEEVEQYKQLLLALAARCRYVFVPEWSIRPDRRLYGTLELKPGTGARHILAAMNLALAALMDVTANVYVLAATPWLQAGGSKPYAPKLDLVAKTPFSLEVFDAASKDIRAALGALDGQAKKVIVVDLDDTLWGGTVGDDGWEHLRLGGHDHVGEAFVSFQRSLLALRNRGIQLAIASKNDESVALEAMALHPEMLLRPEHFAAWRIDWNDKAENLVELSQELRLGLQSFVFIDDNPVERARVSRALPDVLVPELPIDPAFRTQALDRLDCFDPAQITDEDFQRSTHQSIERLRRQRVEPTSDALADWLKTLETQVLVEPLSATNLARVTQLFNKTNQLNLRTRRMSAAEIQDWLQPPNRHLWAVRVRDKFGDAGLTGVISLEVSGDTASVADLILSCRVMGRQIEHAMLNVASTCALQHHADRLRLEYRMTERNTPCLKMLEESRLTRVSDHVFEWQETYPYELPEAVRLS